MLPCTWENAIAYLREKANSFTVYMCFANPVQSKITSSIRLSDKLEKTLPS